MTDVQDSGSSPARPDFAFPILCFTADGDIWSMNDESELTSCGPKTLEDGLQIGMVMVDADGACWRVLSVKPLGKVPFSFRSFRLFVPRQIRIEHELAPETMSFDEIKAKVCASLDAFPLYWCEPSEFPEVIEDRKAEIRAVTSIREIHEKLGLDYFAE
jgi:hypothetical protein